MLQPGRYWPEFCRLVGKSADPAQALAPLPRAYQWIDGSGYLSHLERVRTLKGSKDEELQSARPLLYRRAPWFIAFGVVAVASVATLFLLRGKATENVPVQVDAAASRAAPVEEPLSSPNVVGLPDVSVFGTRRVPVKSATSAREASVEVPSARPAPAVPPLNVGRGRRPLDTENPFKP